MLQLHKCGRVPQQVSTVAVAVCVVCVCVCVCVCVHTVKTGCSRLTCAYRDDVQKAIGASKKWKSCNLVVNKMFEVGSHESV